PGGELVAGGAGTDSCFGDSGGPVYLDTPRGAVVIAAVSRGVDNAATPCGGGGIYVRTDKVVAWLEATTGKPGAKVECGPVPSGSGSSADDADVTGGCSAARDAGLAVIVLAIVLALRRPRRVSGMSAEIRP